MRELSTMDAKGTTPAFPTPAGADFPGVSRRQWYAAMALQGFVARGMEIRSDRVVSDEEKENIMAVRAFRMADAMLRLESSADLKVL